MSTPVSEASEIVISVPHSGTRTLCSQLWPGKRIVAGNRRSKAPPPVYNYIHFGQNDADIDVFSGTAHIPIRNPVDIARSWDGRYLNQAAGGTHSIENMIWRLDKMLEYIENYDDVVLYKIEDIGLRVGEGKKRGPDNSNRANAARQWMRGRMGFYNRYYARP